MRGLRLLVVAWAVCLGPALGWAADKRVALVVGNSTYQAAPTLRNPAQDATAIGDMFKRAGFDSVDIKTDVTGTDFRRALQSFEAKASDADIAVVYYAGHGIEVGGVNYLVPVDAHLATDSAVRDEAVPLDRVQDAMEGARKLRLVILDACRNNPFADSMKRRNGSRGASRGLAKVESDDGATLVAFAAKAGSTAADDNGGSSPFGNHSPYTAALLAHLTTPGLDLRFALGKVHDDVVAQTRQAGQVQTPWVYGALGGDVLALVPGTQPPKADAASAATTAPVNLPPSADGSTAGGQTPAEILAQAQEAARLANEALKAMQQGSSRIPPSAPPKEVASLPEAGTDMPEDTPQPPRNRSTGRNYHYVTHLDPNGDNFLALKVAPDVKSTRIMKMGPNTLLDVVGRRGPWLQVVLTTGQSGWAYGKYVECCRPATDQ